MTSPTTPSTNWVAFPSLIEGLGAVEMLVSLDVAGDPISGYTGHGYDAQMGKAEVSSPLPMGLGPNF